MIIAGVDEAGRGALAGPVVAGAVIFPHGFNGDIFQDSKQLSEKKRNELFETIKAMCDWGVGTVSAPEIDEIGIKPATNEAMKRAIASLKSSPEKLQVDGCDGFQFLIASENIIRGDETIAVISAASIVAKVTRDNYMKKIAEKYPDFAFEKNKGYGCAHHLSLLDQEIFIPEHRKSYEPLRTYLTQGRLF